MEQLRSQLDTMIRLMGFSEYEIESYPDSHLLAVTINDGFITPERLPGLVLNINRIARLIAQKLNTEPPVVVDVNNYRKDRERLIVELAKAAARRALAAGEPVSLPPMNAYERRIVHVELSMRPDVVTESVGEGRRRYVMVKVIEEKG